MIIHVLIIIRNLASSSISQCLNATVILITKVCATLQGHCRPGGVLLGTDSHTCTAGAFGQFATGIGNTDAGFVLGTGKLLLKVPPTLRFVLDREMQDYLLANNLILQGTSLTRVSGPAFAHRLIPRCRHEALPHALESLQANLHGHKGLVSKV